MELAVFGVGAAIILFGGLGVILSRNPVRSALSLVATLFGVAILFIAQDAQFLAVVQVIVYAGAIVVLFLFVIMLLGVDEAESLEFDALPGQRVGAGLVGIALAAVLVGVVGGATITGAVTKVSAADAALPNVNQIAKQVFTTYLFAFEITSALLVIAVVGAVVLAHHRQGNAIDDDEPVTELDWPHLKTEPDYGEDDEDDDEDDLIEEVVS